MLSPHQSPPVTRSAIVSVLGGGRGRRLWPLTKYRAKPAVPVAGKYRLIDVPISNCLNSGLDRIYILTQFNSSSLNRHVTATYHMDPFSRGFVALEAANQSFENTDWYQGTADAVRRNFKQMTQWQTPHLIILPGDTIFRMDLGQLLSTHIESQADITLALTPVTGEEAGAFGIAWLDDDDRIIKLAEKPDHPTLPSMAMNDRELARRGLDPSRPFMASMGIYVFRTELLEHFLQHPQSTDFGRDILPRAVAEGRPVKGYTFKGFWADIGTIRTFYEVNLRLARTDAPFQFFYPETPIYTRMRFLPSTQIGQASLVQSRVTEGCTLGRCRIEQCMVGLRSVIGDDVHMSRTVMMGGDFYEYGPPQSGYEPVPPDAPKVGIGNGCRIDRAIIDKNARVGEGVNILNEKGLSDYDDPEERYYIREGIVIVPKHAILEPGTVI